MAENDPGHLLPQGAWDKVVEEAERIQKEKEKEKEEKDASR
jgi:hypothetical protein